MNWIDVCAFEAEKLSKEKRQEFLDLMWKGKSIGEAKEVVGISLEAACGVMDMNIVNTLLLNKESK